MIASAFVTGHTGFTGTHLTRYLATCAGAVRGFGRSDGDIRDRSAVEAAMKDAGPDVVFHLAALTRPDDLDDLYSVNVLGTIAVLEAAVGLEQRPAVVLVSSSAIYGRTMIAGAVTETARARPLTHYGASKLAQEQVALRYVRAHGLRILVVRPFNLVGPGLGPHLACGRFADAIVQLERSPDAAILRTGNLDASRDFTDVRDAVRAYVAVATLGRTGVAYNVCSGTSVTLAHCLGTMLRMARRPIKAEVDPGRLRPDDLDSQVGDPSRLRRATGWRPEIPLEQSLREMLELRRVQPS